MSRVKLDELWLEDSDDKLYRRVSGGFREVSPSAAGGEGAVNYAKNPLEEDSLSQLTYSGVTPAWSTTHNLFGGGALRCNMTSSGTGRYLRIALDDLSDAQITEMLRLSFFYKLVTGGDDAVRLSIWDGTNHTYLTPEYLIDASGSITKYDGWCFSISKTSHYLQFTFKDSTAIDFYVAAVSFVPRVLPQGAVISATRQYTLNIGATTTAPTKGTVAEDIALWARRGDKMQWSYRYRQTVAGTAGSGTYLFPLPIEFEIDLTKHPIGSVVGGGKDSYASGEGGSQTRNIAVVVHSSTQLKLQTLQDGTGQYADIGSGNHGLSNALQMYSVYAEFCISGWTSSINLATESKEYASNSSSTNADDTTSFVYGPQGSTGVIGVTALTAVRLKRVRFKSRIQPSDMIKIEVGDPAGNWYEDAIAVGSDLFLCPGFSYRSQRGGITYKYVNETDIDVQFNLTPDGASTGWNNASLVGYRWRVKKVSNGNMAEAPASGIYESGQNANGYYVKYVDGTMVQWGVETITAYPHTKTLPVAFADTNWAFASTRGYVSPAAFVMLGSTKTNQACDLYCVTHSGGTISSGVVEWHAIGKWNLSRSVVAPGTPVGASTVFAHYRQSSAYAVGSLQPYDYDELIEDSLGCVTIGSSWKFTAPVSGLYLVTATIPIGASTYSALYKNGALAQQFGVFGSNTAMNACPVSAVIRLAQGDYIDMRSTYTGSISSPDRFIQITRLSA